ncbi:hypothetical protein SDRG_14928 [Saprolegnia diclina VS20]|uniref:Uncharacterized protein n=1 Tax=Saprolegnia diclina (strain VS20) TaxID=1156394 RepID=T0RCI9_SAPDV|nr:hypothetical protein SDRG_14928 [Saprolegnia diclina VS20]EQC27307.1 hypothetical protein SDRG_14928 [Saprolegnia diclina VS20]|eukprot:XP_008619310.1 hypothetical protein SDRG_14928 [Saprolegnia diclina VS20]
MVESMLTAPKWATRAPTLPRKSSKLRQPTPKTLSLHKYFNAGGVTKVNYNKRSVVISSLFALSLFLSPLKAYVSEPFLGDSGYFDAGLPTSSTPTWASAVVADLKQQASADNSNATYHMTTSTVDASVCSFALVARAPGALFYPPDFGPQVLRDLCATTTMTTAPTARAWTMQLVSVPMAVSVAWAQPTGPNTTAISFIHALPVYSSSWVFAKLLWRVLLSVYIGWLLWRQYYRHITHLVENLDLYPLSDRSKTVERYEVLIGDPTSMIISNPIVCIGFCLDILASADVSLHATVRVLYATDARSFLCGAYYLGRHVWFSYAALLVLNRLLRRKRMIHWCVAQSTTVLTVAITVLLSAAANGCLRWYPLVGMSNSIMCALSTAAADGSYYTIEVAPALFLTYLMLALVPVVLGRRAPEPRPDPPELLIYHKSISSVLSASRQRPVQLGVVARAPSDRKSPATPVPALAPTDDNSFAKFDFNDWKRRLCLYLCRPHKPTDADFCSGASMYRLFATDPSHQSLATINGRGTDCYVYSYIAAGQLADVTRVSLVSHIGLQQHQGSTASVQPKANRDAPQRPNVQRFAVGKVLLRLTGDSDELANALLIHGARNSPWIE